MEEELGDVIIDEVDESNIIHNCNLIMVTGSALIDVELSVGKN